MKVIWVLVGLLIVVLAAILWVALKTRSARVAEPIRSREPAPSKRAPRPPATISGPPPPATKSGPKPPASTWGRTVVVPDPEKACPAARRMDGQSFPNESAPRLPLANCSVANCQCHYVPAKERRDGTERRSGTDRRTQLRFEPGKAGDRRSGKDRRHRKGYDWDHTI
jgi:hypothetical protein